MAGPSTKTSRTYVSLPLAVRPDLRRPGADAAQAPDDTERRGIPAAQAAAGAGDGEPQEVGRSRQARKAPHLDVLQAGRPHGVGALLAGDGGGIEEVEGSEDR
jgi:hypothetical protein